MGMSLWFLILFFITFGASGIHTSVLGTAWPVMYEELGTVLSVAGYINMIKALGRVFGGFGTDRFVRKVGTYRTAAIGSFLVAVSLVGFANSKSVWMLYLFSVPMGFGEVFFLCSLNAFVAVHFKARAVNWINMVWSLGSTIGPYIMTICLSRDYSWNFGYGLLAGIQLVMFVLFCSTYSEWKRITPVEIGTERDITRTSVRPLTMKGMPFMMAALFSYIAIENVSGLWASSYLVVNKGITEEKAALGTTILFLGMTIGRLISGFVSDRLGDRKMMNLGQMLVVIGALALAFLSGETVLLLALCFLGLGCAPIYPCFNHYIPTVFGVENTSVAMSFLMGCSQCATLFLPTIFGWVSDAGGMWLFPYVQAFFAAFMMVILSCLKKHCK